MTISSMSGNRTLVVVGGVLLLFVVFVTVEALIIVFSGSMVAAPKIPRAAETYGAGKPLQYVVLGDSTSISQGGDYDNGIARSTARYLARDHAVTFQNFGVSGARAADVATKQVTAAAALKPDVALLDVGANDITHLTSLGSVRASLQQTMTTLRTANPDVAIILTGSPQMGSVPRFPQPVKYLAKVRTAKLNAMVRQLATDEKVVFAPIADRTGPIFMAHPELFAADNFHPTDAGYDTWKPVLNEALDAAVQQARL